MSNKIQSNQVDSDLVADLTVAASDKATPVNADSMSLVDSENGNVLKEITWANVKAAIYAMADAVLSRPEIKDYAETVMAHGAMGATETFNFEDGNVHTGTLDANCTFSFSNPPATGKAGSITLILTQDGTGGWTYTWPAAVKWAGGAAPTLSTGANDVNIVSFLTIDAGTTLYGFLGGADFA